MSAIKNDIHVIKNSTVRFGTQSFSPSHGGDSVELATSQEYTGDNKHAKTLNIRKDGGLELFNQSL